MQSHQVLNDCEGLRPFEITQVYYELSSLPQYSTLFKGLPLIQKTK